MTFKEYIYMGLKTRVMWYFGGVVLLMTMGLFGFGQWGGYVRIPLASPSSNTSGVRC